jgi:hypothetical protein
MSMSKKKNFVFTSEGLQLLDWLKKVCSVTRDADVVRIALSALCDIMIAIQRGDRIIIRSRDGQSEKAYHPFLDLDEEEALKPPVDALERYKKGSFRPAIA